MVKCVSTEKSGQFDLKEVDMLPDGERGFSTKPERTCGHRLRSPSTIRAPKYDSFFDLHWCATQKHLQRGPGGSVVVYACVPPGCWRSGQRTGLRVYEAVHRTCACWSTERRATWAGRSQEAEVELCRRREAQCTRSLYSKLTSAMRLPSSAAPRTIAIQTESVPTDSRLLRM